MRTTLKRGYGRAAEANGNGRAVLPPGVVTPVRVYRQPPPAQPGVGKLVGKFFLWLLAAALIVAAGLVGGAYLWAHAKVAHTGARSRDVKKAQEHLAQVPDPTQPANALIIGHDHPAGIGDRPRSDTVMLVRADPRTKSISLLSFPRDLVVPLHCPGHILGSDRINVAYHTCGASGTLETVKALTGLPISYLISVDFRGFKGVVNHLGGVWIDVDRRYFNNNGGRTYGTYSEINIQPGYQRLWGADALAYVRFRHTDSDLYRVARQQQFVKAVREQIRHSFGLGSLPGIINTLSDNIELGLGGGRSVDIPLIERWALFGYRLPPGHVFQDRIENMQPYGQGGAELVTDQSNIDKAVQKFLNPDVQAPEKATQVALGIKPKTPRGPAPSKVSVTVLNGNGVTGSAANAGFLLGKRGYRIIVPPNGIPANAPNWSYFHSQVSFDAHQRGARLAAVQLAKLFGDADIVQMNATIRQLANGAMEAVTVGQTFHGTLAPQPIDETPKAEPPNVAYEPSVTVPMLRQGRGRVPFRLEYPTLLERSSRPDYELPMRVYRITPSEKAVRLTYKTGQNEYWGIEETKAGNLPVLADRNIEHRIKRRTFDLYYSGPNLHMVVLRENGATYWVVNTLLDSLSNETMLAIAKGLRPLAK
jgi:LCP family protein required for cell wall assembly